MKYIEGVWYAEDGMTFIRIEDGVDYGNILYLGYNTLNGELVEDKIEYYKEELKNNLD